MRFSTRLNETNVLIVTICFIIEHGTLSQDIRRALSWCAIIRSGIFKRRWESKPTVFVLRVFVQTISTRTYFLASLNLAHVQDKETQRYAGLTYRSASRMEVAQKTSSRAILPHRFDNIDGDRLSGC